MLNYLLTILLYRTFGGKMFTPGQIAIILDNRDTSIGKLCKKNGLNRNSVRNTINGSKPVRSVAVWFAQNEPELFNLLPENSRKLVKGEYDGCNIPR